MSDRKSKSGKGPQNVNFFHPPSPGLPPSRPSRQSTCNRRGNPHGQPPVATESLRPDDKSSGKAPRRPAETRSSRTTAGHSQRQSSHKQNAPTSGNRSNGGGSSASNGGRQTPHYPSDRPCRTQIATSYVEEFARRYAVPALFPYTEGQPDIQPTEVGWVKDCQLNHRVKFKVWKEFEKAVQSMKGEIEKLKRSDAESLKYCDSELRAHCLSVLRERSRTEADVSRRAGGLLSAVSEVVQILFGGKFSDFRGSCGGTSLRTEKLLNKRCPAGTSVTPDLVFFANDKDASEGGFPVAAIELKKPPSYVMQQEFVGDMGEHAPEGFIDSLNDLYGAEGTVKDYIAMRFGQVITEAAHCLSGYGMLWTHDRAVFIRVSATGNGKMVDVEVSRMYFCDETGRPGIFFALVAFTTEALTVAMEREESMDSDSVTGPAKILSAKVERHGQSSGQDGSAANSSGDGGGDSARRRSGSGSGSRSGSGSGHGSSHKTGSENRNGSSSSSKKKKNGDGKREKQSDRGSGGKDAEVTLESEVMTFGAEEGGSKTIEPVYDERWRTRWSAPFFGEDGSEERDMLGYMAEDDIGERLAGFEATWDGSERDVSESGSVFEKEEEGEDESESVDENKEGSRMRECMRKWEDDEGVERAYEGTAKFVAMGGCGVVMGGEMDGREIAMKYWNDIALIGKVLLRNEILMHCWLACRHGWTMGLVVPRLVCVGMMEGKGAVLVTEFVGKNVRRDGEGGVMVGDGENVWQGVWERVGVDGFEEIREGALESLEALHECGVLHGDVSMRNIRAVRVETDEESPERCEDGEKEEEGGGAGECRRGRWRAMWLDLGLSELGGREKEFEAERKMCWEMFEKDYVEDVRC